MGSEQSKVTGTSFLKMKFPYVLGSKECHTMWTEPQNSGTTKEVVQNMATLGTFRLKFWYESKSMSDTWHIGGMDSQLVQFSRMVVWTHWLSMLPIFTYVYINKDRQSPVTSWRGRETGSLNKTENCLKCYSWMDLVNTGTEMQIWCSFWRMCMLTFENANWWPFLKNLELP